jgi:hypothetical protein
MREHLTKELHMDFNYKPKPTSTPPVKEVKPVPPTYPADNVDDMLEEIRHLITPTPDTEKKGWLA